MYQTYVRRVYNEPTCKHAHAVSSCSHYFLLRPWLPKTFGSQIGIWGHGFLFRVAFSFSWRFNIDASCRNHSDFSRWTQPDRAGHRTTPDQSPSQACFSQEPNPRGSPYFAYACSTWFVVNLVNLMLCLIHKLNFMAGVCRGKHDISRVQCYPWSQASTGHPVTYPPS